LHTAPDWKADPELLDFLGDGPRPVCVGFGSMTGGDAAQLTDIVVKALQRAGQRGLLLTGWGGMDKQRLPSGFLAIDEAPHDWLFPRVAAVVHHGGCSTTGAALTAGVPSVITPWAGGDQPFWAERVIQLGCGPSAPSKSRLTVESLAKAIAESVDNNQIRENARRMGERLRAEDGAGRAAELINKYIGVASPDPVASASK
jgi:sterol 3beta-glucosyltransferase